MFRIAALLSTLLLPSLAAAGEPASTEPTEPEAPEALEATVEAPPPPVVGFKNGFFIRSPDGRFGILFGGKIQARFTYSNTDGEHRAAFSLPRVRFKFSGHLFDDRIRYKLSIDFGKGGVNLKNAWVDLRADPWAIVRVGQFKVPNSRQLLTSDSKQHFVDLAITDKAFGLDRDLGVMLLNDWKKSEFEYAIGVWNGTGDGGRLGGDVTVDPATGEGEIDSGKFNNVPSLPNPLVVVRVGGHTPGHDGYSESDLADSDFGVGVGGSVYIRFDADDDDASVGGNVDWSLKVKGFSHVGAVYIRADQNGEGLADLELSNIGVHASVAYAIKGRVEPTVRYARLLPPGDSNDTQEILGGVTVYFFKNNVKWATDGGAVIQESTDGTSVTARFRTQLQLDF
jgi:hypothetical protein